MSYVALQFLFWRVFMRITYSGPPHLTFRLRVENWTRLVLLSREAIDWLNCNDECLDSVFIYAYTATSCALIQYHTWARRRDPAALETLRMVKDVAVRWETAVQPDQMSIRRKTCETMTLLYEAALKTNPESTEDKSDRPLAVNLTAGVSPRDAFGRAVFIKDPTRPHAGVWVAHSEEDRLASGIPRDECILASELPQHYDKSSTGDVHDQLGQPHPSPLPQPFQERQSEANVNPQMNFGDCGGDVPGATLDCPDVRDLSTVLRGELTHH